MPTEGARNDGNWPTAKAGVSGVGNEWPFPFSSTGGFGHMAETQPTQRPYSLTLPRPALIDARRVLPSKRFTIAV
jgi:hypothetical protein